VTGFEIPPERDLPAGRLSRLKDDLMTQIEHDHDTASVPADRRRWRRLAATAAVVAVGAALTGSVVVGGDDPASANTAERHDDGSIVITIHDAKHPEQLEQRLEDLGVPAVVDFLDSGYGCDPARSTGWITDPGTGGEELFGHGETNAWVLHPDALEPGQIPVLEFQIDEHDDAIAALATLRLSDSDVGECQPVPNDSIVDAEQGIAGG
jgi:hypothetical protein